MIGLLNLYVDVHAYSAVHECTTISLMDLGLCQFRPQSNSTWYIHIHMYVQLSMYLYIKYSCTMEQVVGIVLTRIINIGFVYVHVIVDL